MKIYTGTGDGGRTSLFSGERLKKYDLRVESYGTVDELTSYIGIIEAVLPDCGEKMTISQTLHEIQGDLFVVGALLATSPSSGDRELIAPLQKGKIAWLEKGIDQIQNELGDLHSFVLPGGHPAAAWCHVVRTICRRSERTIVQLMEREECLSGKLILGYVNRLSDFFFVLARYLNKLSNTEEVLWHG